MHLILLNIQETLVIMGLTAKNNNFIPVNDVITVVLKHSSFGRKIKSHFYSTFLFLLILICLRANSAICGHSNYCDSIELFCKSAFTVMISLSLRLLLVMSTQIIVVFEFQREIFSIPSMICLYRRLYYFQNSKLVIQL